MAKFTNMTRNLDSRQSDNAPRKKMADTTKPITAKIAARYAGNDIKRFINKSFSKQLGRHTGNGCELSLVGAFEESLPGVVKFWNRLPTPIVTAPTVNPFKCRLDWAWGELFAEVPYFPLFSSPPHP